MLFHRSSVCIAALILAISTLNSSAEVLDEMDINARFAAMKASAPEPELTLISALRKTRWNTLQRNLNIVHITAENGTVVSKKELVTIDLSGEMGKRVGRVSGLLRMDLNWDGIVTFEEFKADRLPRARLRSKRVENSFQSADIDSDGQLTMTEIRAFGKAKPVKNRGRANNRTNVLLALDENGDGEVTLPEAERVLSSFFARYDKDGDWVLNEEEWKPIRKARRQAIIRVLPTQKK